MKISIVTVCRNCVGTIEHTIRSVLSQNYNDIEYIIIDGMSTDGTYEIAEKFHRRARLIHEPDCGIYDAMNKGIECATGEYIYFLNSGDVFFKAETVTHVVNCILKEEPDILCGNVNYIYEDGKVRLHNYVSKKMLNPFFLAAGITICHQGVFARTQLIKEKKFDLAYTLWADQEFMAYCMHRKYKVRYINEVICNFDAYGFSSGSDKKLISRVECDRINKKYNQIWYFLFWIPKKIVRLCCK